jgi:predicted dehydrogenase
MLANSAVDVVTICTQRRAHGAGGRRGQGGKHIIVEKPLDITLKRCDAMIAAADKAGVVLRRSSSRFHESSQLLKAAIDKGRFGKLTMGDAYVKWFRTQEYYDSGAWRGTWALDGGGALMNQAVHSVDLLLWFMGPAVEVSAYTATLAHERIEVEDVAVATVKFASGALGTIEASTATWPGELKRIEISGNAGSAIVREEDLAVWKFAKENKNDEAIRQKPPAARKPAAALPTLKAIGHHGHMLQFQDVVNAKAKRASSSSSTAPKGRQRPSS